MIENIKLDEFPQASGVYKIIWNGSVIYIGSSNDLYKRMIEHRCSIKKGSDYDKKRGFYLFLQNSPFEVEFELTENYRQREQELIEYYEPIYNQIRAFTGCGTEKGRKAEYMKEYCQKFKEEMKQYYKQYNEAHKEEMKQWYENHKEDKKQYHNQKCLYKGEFLTLNALAARFLRQGIPHPVLEAKKYLIS